MRIACLAPLVEAISGNFCNTFLHHRTATSTRWSKAYERRPRSSQERSLWQNLRAALRAASILPGPSQVQRTCLISLMCLIHLFFLYVSHQISTHDTCGKLCLQLCGLSTTFSLYSLSLAFNLHVQEPRKRLFELWQDLGGAFWTFGVSRVPVGLLWNSIDDKTMLEGSASRGPKDSSRSPKEAQRRHLLQTFTPISKVFRDYGLKVGCVQNLHRHERIACPASLGEAILDNFCDTLPHHRPATCAEHQQSLRRVPGSRQSPDLGSTGGRPGGAAPHGGPGVYH